MKTLILKLFLVLVFVTPHCAFCSDNRLGLVGLSCQFLGDYLANKYPNKKLLIITGFSRKFSSTMLDGFSKGIDGKMEIVRIDDFVLQPQFEQEPKVNLNFKKVTISHKVKSFVTPSVSDFNAVLVKKDYDIIVSFIGLPKDFKKMDIFNSELTPRPKLFIFDSKITMDDLNYPELGRVLLDKDISGVILPRPKVTNSKIIEKDFRKGFNRYFIFLNFKNLTKVKKEYPTLFNKK